jgi:zinc-ribbon domain
MIAPGMEGVAASKGGFCAKCGVPRIDGAKFCKKCGAPLESDAPGGQTQQPHEAGGQLHGDHAEDTASTPAGAFHDGAGVPYQPGAPQPPPQYAAMHPAAIAPAQPPVPGDGGQSNRLLFTLFVVFGLIAVVALVTVVFLLASHNSGQTAKLVAQPTVVVPSTPGVPPQTGGSTPKTSTPTLSQPRTVTPTPTPAPAHAPPGFPGAPVTGRDGEGFNTGPGCSDNPASQQPGCSDSPSAPSGSDSSCGGGLTVDSQSTSCGLAQNVRSSYHGDGAVTAYSPERGASYTFTCSTGGSGTTHMTICIGRAGSAELYVRWG